MVNTEFDFIPCRGDPDRLDDRYPGLSREVIDNARSGLGNGDKQLADSRPAGSVALQPVEGGLVGRRNGVHDPLVAKQRGCVRDATPLDGRVQGGGGLQREIA